MPFKLGKPSDFSLQGCTASQVGFVPSWRPDLADQCFGLPLFSAHKGREAREARSAPAPPAPGRLSIGHNTTVSGHTAPKKYARIWAGAARAELPGIKNHGHKSNTEPRKRTPRGKILSLSESSRRNLQSQLATLRANVPLLTCVLTCGGFLDHLTHEAVKGAFLRFLNQLSAKTARDALFAGVSGFWKQELQARNALHFHLIIAGLTDENSETVRKWIMRHWVDCFMGIPGMPPEIVDEERRKMEAWHFHSRNWDPIRSEFHAYFAKYAGKDEKNLFAENEIPGRWWGKFNPGALPLGQLKEVEVHEHMAIHAQRVARKIRQTRADNAKHRAICRQIGFVDGRTGQPTVSRFQVDRAVPVVGYVLKHYGNFDVVPLDYLRSQGVKLNAVLAVMCAIEKGLKFGRYVFPPAMKFSSVRLIGTGAPALVVRILEYAGERVRSEVEPLPF